jgi:DNA-directed RNA polymerase beta subunit
MKKDCNYITTLPDFIEMQRISFCWFLSYGLTDELLNFSSIFDFSGNIEYLFFGQEYKLVKPLYNILRSKRYNKNYVTQLMMPIEIRNKGKNIIMRQGRVIVANLPLMTTSATFIINGCDRIIVSQVIRSPGIYFEKNKKKKRQRLNKMSLSTDYHKIRKFTQIPLGLIKNPGFPVLSSKNQIEEKIFTKELEFFKIYRIIYKTCKNLDQKRKLLIFLKWLNFNSYSLVRNKTIQESEIINFLYHIKKLFKIFKKFKILEVFLADKIPEILKTNNINENNFQSFQLKDFLDPNRRNFQTIVNQYNNYNLDNYRFNCFKQFIGYQTSINNNYYLVCNQRLEKYKNMFQLYKEKTQQLFKIPFIFIF